MNKKAPPKEMLPEYDFRGGVRGKYADRLPSSVHLVRLSPDVAKLFPDDASVNAALRACADIMRLRRRKPA